MSGLTLSHSQQSIFPVRARPWVIHRKKRKKKKIQRLPGQTKYKMERSWRRDEEGETHSLDLVADEQNVVLLAELLDLLQVPIIRYEDPGLTLNGLDEECSRLSPHLVEHGGEGGNVVVGDFELA